MAKGKPGAPKGNKNAVGKGRPPIVFSDEQADALGQELLQWLDEKEKKNEPVWHLTDWSWSVKKFLEQDWKCLTARDCFKVYYEIASKRMGTLLMKNKELPTAYGSRFLAMYMRDLKDFEKQVKEETAEIERNAKSKEVLNITPEEMEYNRSIIAGLVALQNRNNQGQESQ